MKIVRIISVLWFLFWAAAGWAEEEIAWGLLLAVFPNLVFWGCWLVSRTPKRKEDAAFAEYLKAIKKIHLPESRKLVRLEYPRTQRPRLNLGEMGFEIVNISERGIKIINDRPLGLDRSVKGEVDLLCGKHLQVEGEVSWSLNNEMGLMIVTTPASFIEEEKKYLKKKYPNAMKLQ